MDLIKEAKKSNKEAYLALVDKYNVLFYKICRIYFTLDMDIYNSLEKALSATFHGMANVKDENNFVCLASKELVKVCEANSKKTTSKMPTDEVSETLLKNAKYRMYKSDSVVEKSLTSIDMENRLSCLLYYYANLDIKDIAYITDLSKGAVQKRIDASRSSLYSLLKDEFSGNDEDSLIKNAFKSDLISDQPIFDKVGVYINAANVKASSVSYSGQKFIVILLLLIILAVCLFLASQYFGIAELFSKKQNVTNTTNNIDTSKFAIKEDSLNIVNTTKTENTIENVVNNTIENVVENTVSNEVVNNTVSNEVASNTVSNTTVQNVVDNNSNTANKTTHATVTQSDGRTDFSNIDLDEVNKFITDFAVGINRFSFDGETLEGNTVLLYVAKHYFDTTNSRSLNISQEYAPTAANIHRYLTEFTGTDYTRKDSISSYSNYIKYAATSKSYVDGSDIKVLNRESYKASDIEMISKFSNTYTANARVTRTLDGVETKYTITFEFSINPDYKYQKYCLKSLKATNLSFYPDNTIHFISE